MLPLLMLLAVQPWRAPVQLSDQVGQDPARLRETAANGMNVMVEPAPLARSLSVHLFASAASVDESATSGLRHLLEHLCATGQDGHLDDRLEAEGGFLKAQTLRDAMDIEVQVPIDKFELAFSALRSVLAAKGWDAAAIHREAGIIEQEIDLQTDESKFSAAAWKSAFGGNGADPLGELSTIKSATPEQVEAVRQAVFATSNMTLVLEGPFTLRAGMKRAMDFANSIAKSSPPPVDIRQGKPGPARAEVDGFGEARGTLVPPVTTKDCAASLCAALAIASEVPDTFMMYTPSTLPGMILIGQTADVGKLGMYVDGLDAGEADELYDRGRALARRWAARQIATPEASAFTRGLLLCRDPSARFEMAQTAIEEVSLQDFRDAIARFKSAQAFTVVGTW